MQNQSIAQYLTFSEMNPKKIRDVKPGGYFTINGTVYQVRPKGPGVMRMQDLDTGELVPIDPERSCLPIDKRAAQILLDR